MIEEEAWKRNIKTSRSLIDSCASQINSNTSNRYDATIKAIVREAIVVGYHLGRHANTTIDTVIAAVNKDLFG